MNNKEKYFTTLLIDGNKSKIEEFVPHQDRVEYIYLPEHNYINIKISGKCYSFTDLDHVPAVVEIYGNHHIFEKG